MPRRFTTRKFPVKVCPGGWRLRISVQPPTVNRARPLLRPLFLLGSVFAVLGGCGTLTPKEPDRGDVPYFRTVEWPAIAWPSRQASDQPGVLLRRESEGAGALLIRHALLPAVWRYDPDSRSLVLVSEVDWKRAGGAIRNCRGLSHGFCAVRRQPNNDDYYVSYKEGEEGLLACPISRHPVTERLIIGDYSGYQEVPFVGEGVVGLWASPSQTMAAVHSADGPRGTPGWPDWLAEIPQYWLGQHYHRIYSLPDGRPVGEPVRLPVRRAKGICWSEDEQFVLYLDPQLFDVTVVHVPEASNP